MSEIEKHKWIESEHAGYDLGEAAVLDWILKYAASYREWWNKTHGDSDGECCSGCTRRYA